MSIPVKLAHHIPSGKIIHIDTAERGLKCECNCIKCNEKLEAVKGNIREKHFRHYNNIYCSGGLETALHKLAKQILVENNEIILPDYGKIIYNNPIQEKYFQNIIPDVSAKAGEQNLFFEILVTHPVDSVKEIFYKTFYHKSIEINLRNCPVSSYEAIKEAVLNQSGNKRLIFWEKKVDFVKIIENFFLKYWFIIIPIILFLIGRKPHRKY